MPLATCLAWRLGAEKGESKDGKIDIHLNSIFVNGVKRRKIAQLSGLPEHDGDVLQLNFSCGGEVRATLVGGSKACSAFVEDCAEVLQKQSSGKRKLDMATLAGASLSSAGRAAAKASDQIRELKRRVSGEASGMERQTSVASEMHERGSVAESVAGEIETCEVQEEDLARTAMKECFGRVLQDLPESSLARPFVAALWSNLGLGSALEAVVKTCEVFHGQVKKQEEVHREEKKLLRAEVGDMQARCERLVRGRDALETQLKLLGTRLKCLKEDNDRLEARLRAGPQPANAGKKARAQKTNAKSEPSDAVSHAAFVQSLVALEVGPLRQCEAASREALKKKILLKWHPDKQPSEEHRTLATQVMQELQNCEDWATQSRATNLCGA